MEGGAELPQSMVRKYYGYYRKLGRFLKSLEKVSFFFMTGAARPFAYDHKRIVALVLSIGP